MKKNIDRRINKTQKFIRLALIDLLTHKTRDQITVKALSDTADINRKTFYSHYTNIEDLFNTIEDEIVDKLMIILNTYDLFDASLDINSLLQNLNEIINEDFDLYEKLIKSDSHDILFTKIKKILKTSLSEKYTNQFELNANVLNFTAEYVSSGVMSMYSEWFKSDRLMSLEELGQVAGTIIFSGISSVIQID